MSLWQQQVLHKQPALLQYQKKCFSSKDLKEQRQLKFLCHIVTTPTKSPEAEVAHYEMKSRFLLLYQSLCISRVHLLLDSWWKDEEDSCFPQENLYMKLFFPQCQKQAYCVSIVRLIVFLLYRNRHIVNSFSQCVEIVTSQAYPLALYSKMTDHSRKVFHILWKID